MLFSAVTTALENKYESFLKKSHILDCKIVYTFYDQIKESLKYRNENTILANVCKMLNENKSLDEVDQYITECKTKYETSVANLGKKKDYAEILMRTLEDEEASKELELRFKDFVKENHPAVKILITKVERMTYDQLRKLYLDNNLAGYEAFLDLQQSFQV